MIRFGFWGWFGLTALCSWPFHALGLPDAWAIGIGFTIACVAIAAAAVYHEDRE